MKELEIKKEQVKSQLEFLGVINPAPELLVNGDKIVGLRQPTINSVSFPNAIDVEFHEVKERNDD